MRGTSVVRPPARALSVPVLTAAVLLTAAACSAAPAPGPRVAASPSGGGPSPAGRPPNAAPPLTQAQARAALITEADLGAPWAPTQGAATWRDGLLKARTGTPDCQRLLDVLYADELLGTPKGTHAVAAFDQPDTEAQLRYQVLALRPADVDRVLAWLETLPRTCANFTATTTRNGVQDVQVFEQTLPQFGDACRGLVVRLTADDPAEDDPTALVLDVAAVRVGDDAITVTNGGTGAVSAESTQGALQRGVDRLAAVHRQGRASA
ncbi:hypothetical protein ABZ920_28575 [Streptomyces sp. NPDC046831]|uniref:hypothetical protein n=1 Tax=Streptomyces sp. NPDC046831 TaxID=3154805 RepID=UPI0033F8FF98